jgi:hypothetical protein
MKVVEQFIRSKLGPNLDTCEDGFIRTNDFCCVVDGATSVTGGRWTSAQITGGQWAARVLLDGVENHLSPTCGSAREAVDVLTKCIQDAYRSEEGVLDIMECTPEERATASIMLYSKHLNQIICVGDCQAALLDKSGKIFQVIQPIKHNDEVMSQGRCMFLQLELARGKTAEELRNAPSDVGRDFIEPLRRGQRLFQNNPDAPPINQYWVMDGFPVSAKGIEVHHVPRKTRQIILASDGYPKLYATLDETEAALHSILKQDPLLMDLYMSTKGVRPPAESFDDRTYLSIDLENRTGFPQQQPVLAAALVAIGSMLLFVLRGNGLVA